MARYSVRSVTEWVLGPASSLKPATGSWTSRTTCMQATRALAGSRKWLRRRKNDAIGSALCRRGRHHSIQYRDRREVRRRGDRSDIGVNIGQFLIGQDVLRI